MAKIRTRRCSVLCTKPTIYFCQISESWILCQRLHMTLSICLALTQNYKTIWNNGCTTNRINQWATWHIQCVTFTRTENNKDALCICSGGKPYKINTGVNIFIINQSISWHKRFSRWNVQSDNRNIDTYGCFIAKYLVTNKLNESLSKVTLTSDQCYYLVLCQWAI